MASAERDLALAITCVLLALVVVLYSIYEAILGRWYR